MTKLIKDLDANLKQLEKNNKTLSTKYEASKQELEATKAKLAKAPYEADREAALKQEFDQITKGIKKKKKCKLSFLRLKHVLSQVIAEKKHRYESLSDLLARLKFVYSDPTPNFNRKQVHGLVANLISIPADKAHNATALEISAGGRLYSVFAPPPQSILLE